MEIERFKQVMRRGWFLSGSLKSVFGVSEITRGQQCPLASGSRCYWPGFRLGVKEATGGAPRSCRAPLGSDSLGKMDGREYLAMSTSMVRNCAQNVALRGQHENRNQELGILGSPP